jgi:methylthioribose-1-phosphate isomerase
MSIRDMIVRGAPSIGASAAFGMACEARKQSALCASTSEFREKMEAAAERLKQTRPTAVNLRWGTDELLHFICKRLTEPNADVKDIADKSIKYAEEILQFHIDANERLSKFGAELLPNNANVITHCNAGPLAACGWGTALGVIRSAYASGKQLHVFVDETRPRNQGAKLTMWELLQDKIPSTLICDSMSGHVMKTKKVDMVITGADRIALNGDSANKIGTYNLAVVANFHNVPFYIAAPLSTIDGAISTGDEVPIEERDIAEMTTFCGNPTTVAGAVAYNPAFDVTPHKLIAGIITEFGVLRPPFVQSITAALASQQRQ